MPLRDHFRPPLDNLRHWESFLSAWPVMMVANLKHKLPRYFFGQLLASHASGDEPACYEMRIHDAKSHDRLVAAVEIVSPSNKDRPENRRLFAAKCAALLQERVSIVVVDIVTTRNQNLYGELLELIGQSDPVLVPDSPPLYAVACRTTKRENEWSLETWTHSLGLGQPLPTLPLWLADKLAVPLELEASYEQSCEILSIA